MRATVQFGLSSRRDWTADEIKVRVEEQLRGLCLDRGEVLVPGEVRVTIDAPEDHAFPEGSRILFPHGGEHP